MKDINTVFFGSTKNSVIVLERLVTCHLSPVTLRMRAVVTQPPRPVGRKKLITPTPVEVWAKKHNIPVLHFRSNKAKPWEYEDEHVVIQSLSTFKPDLLISASYGQKIPVNKLHPTYGGLNVHPSLLPRWRGGDPVPWAILAGDHQTGVTVVTLSEEFDKGEILAHKKHPIKPDDFATPLRTKLFEIGADLLMLTLPDFLTHKHHKQIQSNMDSTYARRFRRIDGYIPWELLRQAIDQPTSFDLDTMTLPIIQSDLRNIYERQSVSLAEFVSRMYHALTPWPGIWTEVNIKHQGSHVKKRLKILKLHTDHDLLVLDEVQLESKLPMLWNQFNHAFLL